MDLYVLSLLHRPCSDAPDFRLAGTLNLGSAILHELSPCLKDEVKQRT